MPQLKRRTLLFVPALVAIAVAKAFSQQNDVVRIPQPPGSISGRVVSVDRGPVWAATVAVRSQESVLTRTVVTDAEGQFVFRDLPPGKYFIRALKSGYVASDFGSRGFGWPPRALALEKGQSLGDVDLRLVRGAAIGGQVLEPTGAPAAGVRISAITKQFINGMPRYVSGGTTQTDDRGFYRLYGLPSATYAVVAVLRDVMSDRAPAERDSMDAVDTEAAKQNQLSRSLRASTTANYLNVFYPGSVDPAAAVWLPMEAGGDKSNANISLHVVRSGKLVGQILDVDGQQVPNMEVTSYADPENVSLSSGDFTTRTTMTTRDGQFTFLGVQPGKYTIVATPPRQANQGLSAVAHILVSGPVLEPIQLIARSVGIAAVSGKVLFETTGTRMPDPLSVRVVLRPIRGSGEQGVAATAVPNRDGIFTFPSVVPGEYVADGTIQGSSSPRLSEWIVKAVTVGAGNMREGPVRIQAGEQLSGIQVTFSTATSELSGRLLDRAGADAQSGFVMLFATDSTLRWTGSGRMRAPTPAATDGTFSFTRLPAGSYYLAVLTDFKPEEWHERSFLEQLVPFAVKIDLKEGERRAQDVRSLLKNLT